LLVTSGDYSRRKHLKGAPIGLALALPSNSKTGLERVSKDKPNSLLGLPVNDEGKKFYNIDPRGQCYKTLFVRDLQIFEKLARNKHYSLLQKSVNYGQKSFIKLDPEANFIKLFTAVIYGFS
jgi:hypothetical protein